MNFILKTRASVGYYKKNDGDRNYRLNMPKNRKLSFKILNNLVILKSRLRNAG